MILVKEMPTTGQFVAVWEYGGNIWSNTFCWDEWKLLCYVSDEWEWCTIDAGFLRGLTGVLYYTVG